MPMLSAVVTLSVAVAPVHVEASPQLDGGLEDPAWQAATAFTAFVQKNPDAGGPPSEPTSVRIVYDDEALWVGIDCVQQRSPIVRRLTRRDREVGVLALAGRRSCIRSARRRADSMDRRPRRCERTGVPAQAQLLVVNADGTVMKRARLTIAHALAFAALGATASVRADDLPSEIVARPATLFHQSSEHLELTS